MLLCLCKAQPLEDAAEALVTTINDLEARRSRLVTKVLACKNRPTELNPTTMAQQVEEAEVRLCIIGSVKQKTKCCICGYFGC